MVFQPFNVGRMVSAFVSLVYPIFLYVFVLLGVGLVVPMGRLPSRFLRSERTLLSGKLP